MAIQIPPHTIKNLVHDSVEIRLRALENVEGKLVRSLALNEPLLYFRPGDLCKQLIRWFGKQPLQSPAKVLEVLSRILRSRYGDEAIRQVGLERFHNEIGKVQKLLKGRVKELQLLEEIQVNLNERTRRRDMDAGLSLSDAMDGLSIGSSLNSARSTKSNNNNDQKDVIIDLTDSGQEHYEVAWSTPTVADFNSMKFAAEILANPHSKNAEYQSVLQHLQATLIDYPAEYMLQTPNIYINLLQLYGRAEELDFPLIDLTTTLVELLRSLYKRLRNRRQCLVYAVSCRKISSRITLEAPQQLRVDRAMGLLLETSINILRAQMPFDEQQQREQQIQHHSKRINLVCIVEVMLVVLEILREERLCIEANILRKLQIMTASLHEHCLQDNHLSIARIKMLLLSFMMHDMVAHNAGLNNINDNHVLFPMLRDYTLRVIFPQRYKSLQLLLYKNDAELRMRDASLECYEMLFGCAIRLLRQPDSLNSSNILQLNILLLGRVANRLQSKKLIELLFNAVLECNAIYPANEKLREKATEMLLTLLQLENDELRESVYSKLTRNVKRHFTCMMNGEAFTGAISNPQLVAAQIIGVPLSTELLLLLIDTCCDEMKNKTAVRSLCEDVLVMLLKSRNLLREAWLTIMALLLPILPMLQGCTHSTRLMDALLSLFDPDAENVPFIYILQGNIAMLFQPDIRLRTEALHRIMFLLTKLDNDNSYLPRITEISDLIQNDLCVVEVPREYKRIFFTDPQDTSNDSATLYNLLNLLDADNIEPLVRKTTLMQLSLLCQNWELCVQFCTEQAPFLLLQALENSMRQSSAADYTDTAIPAISGLVKVLFVDASVRERLTDTPNIYVLLLRALMFYHGNIQVRQDVGICLFQLIFGNFMVIAGPKNVQLPRSLGNLLLPLKCELRNTANYFKVNYSCNAANTDNELHAIFDGLPKNTENYYWRQFIAAEYYNNNAQYSGDIKFLEAQRKFDYTTDLQMTQRDFRFLRATDPEYNLRRFLRAIANATDHKTISDASASLRLQLMLQHFDDVPPISHEIGSEIYGLLSKYLHVVPSSDLDCNLYEQLLELSMQCVNLPLFGFIQGLTQTLDKDIQHAFLTMLRNTDASIRIFMKVCQLLDAWLAASAVAYPPMPIPSQQYGKKGKPSQIPTFHSTFFEHMFTNMSALFACRSIHRVRGLLRLLLQCSLNFRLLQSDEQLNRWCKQLYKISISLRSSTQVGSQIHRDCLQMVVQLRNQMEQPLRNFSLTPKVMTYMSSQCGHSDGQVRALVWCILAAASRFIGEQQSESEEGTNKNDDQGKQISRPGANMLISELSYLPGGFLACCLCTLLDHGEWVLIRQLAGNLFAELLSDADVGMTLLDNHIFFRVARDSLDTYISGPMLPRLLNLEDILDGPTTSRTIGKLEVKTPIATCEIVICYCRICIRIIELQPSLTSTFCEKSLLMKLYELIKLPAPSTVNGSGRTYYSMYATICQLYGLCYAENFPFLQRTLCRDQVWLASFYRLLNQPIMCKNADSIIMLVEEELVCVLQLLLILCQDESAYTKLIAEIAHAPMNLMQVFTRSFDIPHLGTALQRNALAVLALLLIKSQKSYSQTKNTTEQQYSFPEILENSLKKVKKITQKPIVEKENDPNELNRDVKQKKLNIDAPIKVSSTTDDIELSPASIIYIALHGLFQHLYPMAVCKFKVAPTASKVQVMETLSLLLKFSKQAQESAENAKLLPSIIRIFQTFFDEFTICCTTFVRRYGETRKMAIVENFRLLFNVLLNWFSGTFVVLSNELNAHSLTKILQQVWPWLAHSSELKLLVFRLCTFLSERSLVMCQQFCATISPYAHTILELVVKSVIFETTKVKAASSENTPIVIAGVRVLMNCCACADGRVNLAKLHFLHTFDNIYPLNTKGQKLQTDILISLLQFWELYSRYPEGAAVREVGSLCSTVERLPPLSNPRLYILKILRNMCFLASNRLALTNCKEFLYTIEHVISTALQQTSISDKYDNKFPISYEEQLIVSVSVWQLLSNGIKFIAKLRGTHLSKSFHILRGSLQCHYNANVESFMALPFACELVDVLDIILNILNYN